MISRRLPVVFAGVLAAFLLASPQATDTAVGPNQPQASESLDDAVATVETVKKSELAEASSSGDDPADSSNGTSKGQNKSRRVFGSFIVDLKSGEDVDEVADDVAADAGGKAALKYKRVLGGFAFEGPDDALDKLRNDPRVARAEPDYVVEAVDAPLIGSGQADHLTTVGAAAPSGTTNAYSRSLTEPKWGGAGIRVAILDTGVQPSHTAFGSHSNVDTANSHGACVGASNGDDLNGHGTATAGNAAGRIGAAHLAKVHPIKVFPGTGTSTSWSYVICGIDYVKAWNNSHATADDIRVANFSLAGGGIASLQTAVESLVASGVVVVAAAGNSRGSSPLAPAQYAGVISVSALNHAGTSMMSWSNKGAKLTAPGESIYSPNFSSTSNNAFSLRSGTSRSSPIVAGAAAVALAFNPALTPAQVLTLLEQTGKCPNGTTRGGSACTTNWPGDTAPPEPRVNVFCAGAQSAGLSESSCTGSTPATPTLSINDVSASEGNSGTKTFNFTVSRSAPTTGAVSVNYATSNGSATAPSDYVAKSGTLNIASGATSGTIGVVVNGDTTVEANETFNVTLSSPSGATISDGTGVGTINNDDSSPPSEPSMEISNSMANEGNSGQTDFTFTVTLSSTTSQQVSVQYTTVNNSAVAPGDYTAKSGTLIIPANASSGTITIKVNGDTSQESYEVFVVVIGAPVNATISDAYGFGIILNDD